AAVRGGSRACGQAPPRGAPPAAGGGRAGRPAVCCPRAPPPARRRGWRPPCRSTVQGRPHPPHGSGSGRPRSHARAVDDRPEPACRRNRSTAERATPHFPLFPENEYAPTRVNIIGSRYVVKLGAAARSQKGRGVPDEG